MVKKWKVTIPKLSGNTPRRVYVCLPEGYDTDSQTRYPVMYMFDGHNLFFDEDATFGKSWGMAKYMKESGKKLIIVGIECNHEGNRRLMEYSPVSYRNSELGRIRGTGAITMDWIIRTLKPHIDTTYRTLPQREHTIIAGSSMGGLMALYGVTAFNHVFRRAACLSPSLWVAPGKVLALAARTRVSRDTVVYMDYGELELPNHAATRKTLASMSRLLMAKGVNLTMRIIPGGNHSEASWEKQVPLFMECLGL